MVKNPVLLYKTLVVGVIVLFIGVGIQPAFAVTSNPSDSKDDCNLCPKVSNLRLVLIERLVNRVETSISKLSVVSKLNPVIKEKSQELSDAIITLKEMNKELKEDTTNDNTIICVFLGIIVLVSDYFGGFFWVIMEQFSESSIIKKILFPIFAIVMLVHAVSGGLFFEICIPDYP